jgi:hypothetical protein
MCKWGLTSSVLVTIPADLSSTGKVKIEWKEIDSCISGIVSALETAGIKMRSSCCGHRKADGEILLSDGRALIIKAKHVE